MPTASYIMQWQHGLEETKRSLVNGEQCGGSKYTLGHTHGIHELLLLLPPTTENVSQITNHIRRNEKSNFRAFDASKAQENQ